MSRFPDITLDRLGKMQVLEDIDSETLIASRMVRFKELWTENDPPLGADYDVEGLEFDPIKINQEANAYFETLLRDRVNQAARAVTLAYASGQDLDAIGSRYPNPAYRSTILAYARNASYLPTQPITPGLPRLALVDDPPGNSTTNPEAWETDDRYRRRLWLAGSAFNTAGAEDAYVFWALTTVPALRDASAMVVRPSRMEAPIIVVTLLQEGADPIPTPAQIVGVRSKLHEEGIKPASDIIQVRGPRIFDLDYRVVLEVYPGADKALKEAQVTTALADLKERKRYLGEDQTLMAIQAACAQADVQNARILSLGADLKVSPMEFAKVNKIDVRAIGENE